MDRENDGLTQSERVFEVLQALKRLAQEYRALTGKPLGITGEVAEFEAARILGLQLTPARQEGYDAIEHRDGEIRRLQIKGACVLDNGSRNPTMPSINIRKDFDAVLLVLLNRDYAVIAIYEADRQAVSDALTAPGSKARNTRGSLKVSKFTAIGRLRWGGVEMRTPREKFGSKSGRNETGQQIAHVFTRKNLFNRGYSKGYRNGDRKAPELPPTITPHVAQTLVEAWYNGYDAGWRKARSRGL